MSTEPIHLLHICLSKGWGGLEMYPARITPHLCAAGLQVHACAWQASKVSSALKTAGAHVYELTSWASVLTHLPKLLAYIRRTQIHVIHCHKSSDLRLAALISLFLPQIRIFFTDHMGVTRPKKDLYHRWVYRKVTRIFSISETTYQRNLRAFPVPAERITRLYYGVDLQAYQPQQNRQRNAEIRAHLRIPEDAVCIGLPGRLSPGKGQEYLLQAADRLRTQPELKLHYVLIGGLEAAEGADEDFVATLQAFVQSHQLSDHVSFSGFRTDLPAVLEAMDIICIPSRNEAFGLVVIEAMALGKAIIGANTGAIPELLQQGRVGQLVDPQSGTEIAEAIGRLAQEKSQVRALGQLAQARAHQYFDLKQHLKTLIGYYRQALPKP
ncbi:Glycosyltransferase involved in cell wall bisynthesis [Allopseudospirillum japonicum]|uniref:Glycosyltransferase involved in cell wall bisynthesis n=1 Tax=Allopseudospirillum japonicum TaxID=64971 RepID=A0A1H6UHN1_9GAMM|nr:glycosyltransferase family 4 protein [Allopseudospirillum japonicum]SEI91831.1 Glycosyltransferase involved in cell wall bisynthesis [Allopseudospirillum japonicum]